MSEKSYNFSSEERAIRGMVLEDPVDETRIRIAIDFYTELDPMRAEILSLVFYEHGWLARRLTSDSPLCVSGLPHTGLEVKKQKLVRLEIAQGNDNRPRWAAKHVNSFRCWEFKNKDDHFNPPQRAVILEGNPFQRVERYRKVVDGYLAILEGVFYNEFVEIDLPKALVDRKFKSELQPLNLERFFSFELSEDEKASLLGMTSRAVHRHRLRSKNN